MSASRYAYLPKVGPWRCRARFCCCSLCRTVSSVFCASQSVRPCRAEATPPAIWVSARHFHPAARGAKAEKPQPTRAPRSATVTLSSPGPCPAAFSNRSISAAAAGFRRPSSQPERRDVGIDCRLRVAGVAYVHPQRSVTSPDWIGPEAVASGRCVSMTI